MCMKNYKSCKAYERIFQKYQTNCSGNTVAQHDRKRLNLNDIMMFTIEMLITLGDENN